MKIVGADVIACSPGRSFITVKIVIDEGVHGVGDATLDGGEPAVARFPFRPAHLPVARLDDGTLWHW